MIIVPDHHSTAGLPAIRPLRFGVLVSVEVRKLLDTRGGRALVAATVAASVAVLAWKTTHASVPTAFDNYSRGVATMVAFLTPILGLLAMTSEWTQRTAFTTFVLVPRRLRVIAAKYVAALVISLTALGTALVIAAAAVAVAGTQHGPAHFAGWVGDVRYAMIFVLLQVTMAAAFGALCANTPIALSSFLLAPTLWVMLAAGPVRPVADWFDIFAAYGRLSSNHPLGGISRTLTAVAVWVVLPAAVGLTRSLRREIK